jgi:co-chaperonin GroES (HSP10)
MIERIPSSFVLVEIDSLFHENILFQDGRELLIDPTYEPEKHLQTSGIVHTVPDSLYFNKKDMHDSMEYDVPIELKKGDKVFFHYLQLDTAIKRKMLLTIDDKLHAFIRYDQCFCAIRDDEFITLNGWMLLEPYGLEDEVTSELIQTKIPRSRRRSHPLKGKIVHLGTPVNEYLWSKHESDKGVNVEVGDNVMFTPHSDIPLEYDMHQKLDKIYYRVQRKDLLNKLI